MSNLAIIKYRLGRAWLSGVLILLSLYFCVHVFVGESGLGAREKLDRQQGQLLLQAQELASERALLERRVALLRGHYIDPDLLEEEVRSRLGFTHPDDIIIYSD